MSVPALHVRRPSPALVVSLLALLMASAGMASAAIPDGNDLIHGCIVNRTGALRVIDTEPPASAACTSKETAITWNQTGPAGEPGPTGSISGTYVRSFNAGPSTVATVGCDTGDVVTGGGASSDGTLSDVHPYTSGFGSDLPIGYRATRVSGSQLTVYVICVDVTP